jgi:asparagine synthase (glutamine-hydrolysing)
LIERWHLRDRVASDGASLTSTHPLRSEAHRRLSAPSWPAFLERADPGFTGVPVEHRWPFLDVRLVNYTLAIPPLPWCVDKQLLRLAMQDSLPSLVLRRRKSPLADDPLRLQLQEGDWSWLDRFGASPQLSRFINRAALPSFAGLAENPWSDLRPFCLNYWLSRNAVAA